MICQDGSEIPLMEEGRFVLAGTEGTGTYRLQMPFTRRNVKKGNIMAKVGIVMGSDSDMPVMAKAADILEKLGIEYEMTIISRTREPDAFFDYAKTAEERA